MHFGNYCESWKLLKHAFRKLTSVTDIMETQDV